MIKKLNTLYLVLKWHLYKKWLIKRLAQKSFKGLTNKNFSIFANNCAAGFVYQDSGLPYLTPTIGLFFHSPCYIKLLENFEWIHDELQFVNISKYETSNKLRSSANLTYPIAIIGNGVEIHFLHYTSNEEALEKWSRRLKKINFDNLLFLFCVRELNTDEHVYKFCAMPFKNKLCISAKSFSELSEVIQLGEYEKDGEVAGADITRIPILRKVNFANILNNMKS
jgi:uncharacterized protein (DUF1919 family)